MSIQTQMIQIVPAGTDILCEGYCSAHVFVLLEGRVRVSRCDGQGQTIVLAELGHGEVFGEMGLISQQPSSATVTAIDEVKLRKLDKEQFSYALAHNPSSVEQVLQTLLKRMRQMNDRVMELEQLLAEQGEQAVSSNAHQQPKLGKLCISGCTPQARHALGDQESLHIDTFPFQIGRHSSKKKSSWFASKGNDLDIHDIPPYGLSQQHCRVTLKKNTLILSDHSRMGTWLDDQVVEGQITLTAGIHRLSLGSAYSQFSFELQVS